LLSSSSVAEMISFILGSRGFDEILIAVNSKQRWSGKK
jgi:hypothetical protein